MQSRSSMLRAVFVISLALLLDNASATRGSKPSLNFKATFGDSPELFTLDVDDEFMADAKQRAISTRLSIDLNILDFEDGIPSHNVSTLRDYWKIYDWGAVQTKINTDFKQFTTTVSAGPNYAHPVPLHFVHHRSSRPDAIPLLFIHGWPGSFLEVGNIISNLTNPDDDSKPSFHVVAPSLPGFGFSPAPEHLGLGLRESGQAFNQLMKQLSYEKYVIQGGDFGSHTLRHMASDFPDSIVSVLSNEFMVNPNATDLARLQNGEATADEAFYMNALNTAGPVLQAYWGIHALRPLQVGIAMANNPVAYSAWIYDGMRLVTPGYAWSAEELVAWSLMHYIQGPYGSIRMYKEASREGAFEGRFPYVHQPLGVAEFPGDVSYAMPRDWAERQGNVTYFNKNHTHGGHFPAHTNSEGLLHDIWGFWGNESLSGTAVFRRK